MRYPIASNTWDEEESRALTEVVESGHFTMGARVREFEEAIGKLLRRNHAVMVNSGSSANLLTVASQLYAGRPRLAPGDQVIVPAVSWGTTFFPVHQHELELRFVDVEEGSFNIDPRRVEEAVTPRTRAIFAVNILGAPCDFDALASICDAHDLVLLEDNCESLGARYGDRFTGTFGSCSSLSTYFSHHLSTMEGGLVLTDDDGLSEALLSLRAHGWTRDLPNPNDLAPPASDPFHDLFRFVLPGYNLRPTEMAAAAGLCQLPKLGRFLAARRANAETYQELFEDVEYAATQESPGSSSWFSFALVLRGPLAGRRDEVVRALRDEGVETRPIVSGNFTRNPVIRHLRHSIAGPLLNADRLDREGFLVGNHHYDVSAELHWLRGWLDDFAR